MKTILGIFTVILTIIFLFTKGSDLYIEREINLVNDGYYNIYNHEMNEQLIKEVNEYVNGDYFSNVDDFILKDNSGKGYPLSTIEPYEVPNFELLDRSSYKKHPLLYDISFQIYKHPDGFSAHLGSEIVAEYIYYCEICNFKDGYVDNILRKDFGANIIKINNNLYHVYYHSWINS